MAFYCTLAAEMSSVGERSHKNVNFICLASFSLQSLALLRVTHGDIFESKWIRFTSDCE